MNVSLLLESLVEHAEEKTEIKYAIIRWVQAQCLLLKEQTMLLFRDPSKYARLVTAMNAGDMTFTTKGIRYAYFFCRRIDDVMDGDRPVSKGFENVEEMLLALQKRLSVVCKEHEDQKWIWIFGNMPTYDDELLLRFFLETAGGSHSSEINECLLRYLDSARDDFHRRMQRTVLPEKDLLAAYDHSFEPVQDLAFIALGSRTRSRDIPTLSRLQGRSYALRDLSKEFPRGEINIPLEVMSNVTSDEDTLSASAIAEWKKREIAECEIELDQILSSRPQDGGEKWVKRILLPPIKKIIANNAGQSF